MGFAEVGSVPHLRLTAQVGDAIVTPAQLGILTFRVPGGDAAQDKAALAARSDANAFVATTTLKARTVIRLCCINFRATAADLAATFDALEAKS